MGMSYTRSTSPLSGRRKPRFYICLYATLAIIIFFAFFVYTPLPTHDLTDHRDALVSHLKDNIPTAVIHKPSNNHNHDPVPSLNTTNSTYAYATFLATNDSPLGEDKYYTATRILAYQLLHAPETRTTNHYPFIVLVTASVSEAKRERLRRDGAIVWEAPPFDAGWVTTDVSTWQNVMSKLRLWELTQFERICFLDGDTVLVKPLDDIFNDRSVISQSTATRLEGLRFDEAPMPPSYVFAGVPEMEVQHHYPPSEADHDWPNIDYLNAGFFVLQPSLALLDYYTSLTALPDRFNPHLPEQNLLNYAHRREGNMAWKQLDTKWNIHYPTTEDLRGGVASLHEKWWAPINEELGPFLRSWRWRMEGFWEGREGMAR
ncbi:hypothetical protein LTR08_001848 [Meristemomyces frigidus]|nr:hypothetical protein LTR08_001848 [Meristemomyces frigidus]